MFSDVDFGSSALSISASIAGKRSGNVELRLGSISGTLIGTIPVVSTDGWQTWQTFTANLTGASGVHDLYLVFISTESGSLFNLDYLQFSTTLGVNEILESKIKMYPNPVKNELHINKARGAKVDVYDTLGKLILTQYILNDESVINTSSLNAGIYFIRFQKDKGVVFKKIIKN